MPNRNKIKTAFTLIEISLVIIVIGILIAAIANGTSLMSDMRLAAARSLSKGSPVSSIPDLMLWYDATSEESFKKEESRNDLFISQWNDINPTTTSKFDLTQLDQTRKPQYKKSGINNLPAIYFNGANFLLRSNVDSITSLGSASVFIVFLTENIVNQKFLVMQPVTNCVNNIEIGININNYSGNFGVHSGCGRSTLTNINVIEDKKPTISSLILKPSPLTSGSSENVNIFKNGILQNLTIVSSGYNSALSGSYAKAKYPFLLGARDDKTGSPTLNGSYDCYFLGYIGEVIIFQRDLDDYEIDSVHEYLGQKWGIKLK